MIRKPCCSRFSLHKFVISNFFGHNSKTCICEVRLPRGRVSWGLTVTALLWSKICSTNGNSATRWIHGFGGKPGRHCVFDKIWKGWLILQYFVPYPDHLCKKRFKLERNMAQKSHCVLCVGIGGSKTEAKNWCAWGHISTLTSLFQTLK